MTEFVVEVEDYTPEIIVEVGDPLPDIEVEVQEVGLKGAKGDTGATGATGADASEIAEELILEHVNSPLPHPVYDDGPSFLLFYANAKV